MGVILALMAAHVVILAVSVMAAPGHFHPDSASLQRPRLAICGKSASKWQSVYTST